MLFNKGEAGEREALDYLKKYVPSEKKEESVDLAQLNENFFDISKELKPGHHEFRGKNDIKIIFDLVEQQSAFYKCYNIYGHNKNVQGEYDPIYLIENLRIETNNFSYNINNHIKPIEINWLPNLESKNSKLSYSYIDIGRRKMYMVGKDGYFSRPIDLLGYFHEVGHVETRGPDQINKENETIKTTISARGVEKEVIKEDAYILQRERDANAWLLKKTADLFKDLNIPVELVKKYIHNLQLESYHDVIREEYLK